MKSERTGKAPKAITIVRVFIAGQCHEVEIAGTLLVAKTKKGKG